jgi:hypothetical protein
LTVILAPGQRLDHTVVGALPCPTEYTVGERIAFVVVCLICKRMWNIWRRAHGLFEICMVPSRHREESHARNVTPVGVSNGIYRNPGRRLWVVMRHFLLLLPQICYWARKSRISHKIEPPTKLR